MTLLFNASGSGPRTIDDLTYGGSTTTVIPEPATMALMGAALTAIGFLQKRLR